MELGFATANAQRGQTARIGNQEITFIATDDAPLADADLIFTALPHGSSLEWVKNARSAGAKVVDLSSDLRPGNGGTLDGAQVPYGLPELYRSAIPGAQVVSNPGCYPTSILVALAPLVTENLLEPGSTIAVTAASGVTGAGFTPRPDLLFAEISEDFRAYGIGNNHRHLLEMNSVMKEQGSDNDLIFTPHLLPVARGILATIVVRLTRPLEDPLGPWSRRFGGEPFVELSTTTPSLRDVVRRNVVRISAVMAANTSVPTLIITSAIDNLTKGAAGQAVQNANIMFGFDESLGLLA
jgi:N-acetyl-gamma-glutamyl-phosphate reductase